MNEIWKDVIGYEGKYQVSNLGNVKSLSRVILRNGKHPFISKEKDMKNYIDKFGYCNILLCKDSIRKRWKIHQLVAMAFLGHIPNGNVLVVDHINDVKTDNRLENLQVVSNRENSYKTQGRYSSKYKGVHFKNENKKWRAAIQIGSKIKHLGYFESEYDAHIAYQNKLNEI